MRRQLAEGTALAPPRLAAWPAAPLATFTPQSSHSRVAWARATSALVRCRLGFGRIVALHLRPSALYQINSDNRCLFF